MLYKVSHEEIAEMLIDQFGRKEMPKGGKIMKRLTERLSNGQAAVFGCGNNCEYDYKYCNNHLEDCPTINKIYEKLARYEDLQEQGKLVKLPCAVGDTVYVLHIDNESYLMNNERLWEIVEEKFEVHHFDYIGKTVFSTRKAAEKELEEMGQKNREVRKND